MKETQPIDISLFIPSVELERTEPKNRFDPASADYDQNLDAVMNHFPIIKSWYTIGFKEHTSKFSSGLSFNGNYKQEILYPTLVASKVIKEIKQIRSPQSNIPYIYNPLIIEQIVNASNPKESEPQDIISEILKTILIEIPLTEYEFEGFFSAHNLLIESDFYESLCTKEDTEIAKWLRTEAYEELNKRRPPAIVKKQ